MCDVGEAVRVLNGNCDLLFPLGNVMRSTRISSFRRGLKDMLRYASLYVVVERLREHDEVWSKIMGENGQHGL